VSWSRNGSAVSNPHCPSGPITFGRSQHDNIQTHNPHNSRRVTLKISPPSCPQQMYVYGCCTLIILNMFATPWHYHDDVLLHSAIRDSALLLRFKFQNTPSLLRGVDHVNSNMKNVWKLVHVLPTDTTIFFCYVNSWYVFRLYSDI